MGIDTADVQTSEFPIRVCIISDVRFLRESLAEVLPREAALSISGLFSNIDGAVLGIVDAQPHVVLLDDALPGGLAAVRQIRRLAPYIPVVVFAVAETAEKVITWAEAGVAGYIPRTAGLADIVPLLLEIRRGKQPCSSTVAGGLLRQLSSRGVTNGENHHVTSHPILTVREAQIAQMIATGMSNKDIARRLNIGLATAKTHVHHLLVKLKLQRRGQAASWMRQYRSFYPEL